MQELINDLMIWAVTLTSFEQPIKLPTVEAVSHQQLLQTLCDDQFCTAVAYYDTETRTIFYDERMEVQQDQSARGFIVDEMRCEQRIKKEQQAYRVQQFFLREHRQPTYQIDLAMAVLANVCKNANVSP